jgi:hypothetical protein
VTRVDLIATIIAVGLTFAAMALVPDPIRHV